MENTPSPSPVNFNCEYSYQYRSDIPEAMHTFHGRPIGDFNPTTSSETTFNGHYIKDVILVETDKQFCLIHGALDQWAADNGSTHTLVNTCAAWEMSKIGYKPKGYIGHIHPYFKHLRVRFVGRRMEYLEVDNDTGESVWTPLPYRTVKW
jgi:hypothetical protein